MSTDHPHEAPLVRDLTNRETRIRLVDKHFAHCTPDEREQAIAELDEDAAAGELPVLTGEQWGELDYGDPKARVYTHEHHPDFDFDKAEKFVEGMSGGRKERSGIKPARRGDERRKVRWVRSRDGRSKYTPHAGQKELAKLVGREGDHDRRIDRAVDGLKEGTSTPNDNETTI